MTSRLFFIVACVLAGLGGCATNTALVTEPFLMTLPSADDRVTEVRVVPPTARCQPCDAIVFSHGFNLSHSQYDVLMQRWADAGFLILAPLHMDSEAHPERANIDPANTLAPRLEDFIAVVERLNDDGTPVVPGINYSGRYFAIGHSYGALIAQLAGGATDHNQTPSLMTQLPTAPDAIVAISPPGSVEGFYSAQGWRNIKRPHLVVTGTTDVVPGIAPQWDDHLDSFEASPPGLSFALVFDDMDHYFDGQFGRIKDLSEPYSRSAIKTLNDITLRFLGASTDTKTAAAAFWPTLNSSQVEARSR